MSIVDVRKQFGHGGSGVLALDGVSLDVAPGEFVCLLGASGCGKSTLLNLVAGLDKPTSGTVDVRANRTALMFQEAALFPWLTVRGNVELALKLSGTPRERRRERSEQLLEMVHLTDFAKKRPHELSGGMRQRTALARALAQDAQVLLMDEPFGALDAMTRDVLARRARDACGGRTGKTVMFVTHNVREAIRLGDRVVLLTSRPGPGRPDHLRRRSNDRGASTRPRSRPWRRRSPTAYAKRWSVMPAGSETLHPVEDPDIAAFEEQFGARPVDARARSWSALWPKLLAVALFVGAWQVVVWTGWKDEFVLPSPFTVFDQFWQDKSTLWEATQTTLLRAIKGYSIALVIGVAIGVARLAVEDPALRRRLDDHRPADHAVDRVVPRRRSSCSALSE